MSSSSTLVELERPRSRCIVGNWKPVRKNTLRGFVDVELANGLVFHDVAVHEARGRRWAMPAAVPQLDAERRQRTDPTTGKLAYKPSIRFASRELQDRFSRAVIGALAAAGIEPFDEPEREDVA